MTNKSVCVLEKKITYSILHNNFLGVATLSESNFAAAEILYTRASNLKRRYRQIVPSAGRKKSISLSFIFFSQKRRFKLSRLSIFIGFLSGANPSNAGASGFSGAWGIPKHFTHVNVRVVHSSACVRVVLNKFTPSERAAYSKGYFTAFRRLSSSAHLPAQIRFR